MDVAQFTGAHGEYLQQTIAPGVWVVSHQDGNGADGVTLLVDVEIARFADVDFNY